MTGAARCTECGGMGVVAHGDLFDPFDWCPKCGGDGLAAAEDDDVAARVCEGHAACGLGKRECHRRGGRRWWQWRRK